MRIDLKQLSQKTLRFGELVGEADVDIAAHIEELRQVLKQHNYLYYVTASPIISDVEYDELFALLQEWEVRRPDLITPESPTQQLSTQLLEGFAQAKHLGVMQSLQNTYTAEEIQHRHAGIARLLAKAEDVVRTYIVEPKFDGMSVEIVYAHGQFVRAVTRGDGKTGEDITEHARLLHGLPMYIPALASHELISLRGEIVMPKTAFERLTTRETTSGGLEFANARNATAGTLRHLNPQLVKKRGLTLEIYDILFSSTPLTVSTGYAVHEIFAGWGLHTHPLIQSFAHIDEVVRFCTAEKTLHLVHEQDVQLDGLVIKINELSMREIVGSTSHHPRRAIAYKFPAEQVTTQLESVHFQVGRTGVLTPVAYLAPVQIGGVTVQRATLHNREFIQQRELRLHDRVVVQRSGEVIPYIVSVVKERRTGGEIAIDQPHHCPVCNHAVYFDVEGGSLRCGNSSCTAQIKQRLQHFVSKGCLDIAGIGPRLIDAGVDAGLLHALPDIYALTTPAHKQRLTALPGVGTKKIALLEKELEKARHQPLRKVLFGLSIRHVGAVIAQDLMKVYQETYPAEQRNKPSFLAFCTEREQLLAISGIGPQIADALQYFFEDEENRSILDALDALEVIDRAGGVASQINPLVVGKQIVLTGSLPIGRIDLTNLLQQQGAKVTGSVSSQTDILVYGEHAGSKLKMAQELGVSIYSFDDFCHLFEVDTTALRSVSSPAKKEPSQEGLFG